MKRYDAYDTLPSILHVSHMATFLCIGLPQLSAPAPLWMRSQRLISGARLPSVPAAAAIAAATAPAACMLPLLGCCSIACRHVTCMQ
jgi:hypothetical protein